MIFFFQNLLQLRAEFLGALLMGGLNVKVDIQKLLSFGDDLIELLNSKKDAESLMQSMEGQKIVHAAAREDAKEIHASLEGNKKNLFFSS